MSLFGSVGTTSSTAASNTATGDLSKDVALTSPPEDSISDLAFSPVSDHLAVSSWDKKVRIYEINEQGMSEGKAIFEHEAPVLNCCWSPVSIRALDFMAFVGMHKLTYLSSRSRTVPKLSELALTKQRVCLISPLTAQLLFKWPHTKHRFEVAA